MSKEGFKEWFDRMVRSGIVSHTSTMEMLKRQYESQSGGPPAPPLPNMEITKPRLRSEKRFVQPTPTPAQQAFQQLIADTAAARIATQMQQDMVAFRASAYIDFKVKSDLGGLLSDLRKPGGAPGKSYPGRFVKRPVVVEAWRYDGTNGIEIMDWVNSFGEAEPIDSREPVSYVGRRTARLYDNDGVVRFEIDTLEGTMEIKHGAYVIQGIRGEFYPCDAEIFAGSYAPATGMEPAVDESADVAAAQERLSEWEGRYDDEAE